MSNQVIRLGGSHIGNPDSIKHLYNFLNKNGGRKFVVVSAVPELLALISYAIQSVFSKELNIEHFQNEVVSVYHNKLKTQISERFESLLTQLTNLLKGIALIGDYSAALKDQVLCFSEILTAEMLISQWKNRNKEVLFLHPEEIELSTSSDFGNASFLSLNSEKIHALQEGFYIIPGSFGLAENGRVARTGSSAADYTAAFLTKELEAEKLELWGLDHDFKRADARIIQNSPRIKRLTYAEASELAYFDHYSFHPRTVEPLEHEHIPIEVLRSDSSEGIVETIINTETFVEDQIVKSVACSEDVSLLKLDGPGVGLKPGILAKVTTQLNDSGINIKSVITSQTSINFILAKETGDQALHLVHKLGFSAVTEISLVKDIALIGVVGHGMQNAFGVSAKIFTAVANNKINVVLSGSGASDLVSYLIVDVSNKEKSVREIYNAFFGF